MLSGVRACADGEGIPGDGGDEGVHATQEEEEETVQVPVQLQPDFPNPYPVPELFGFQSSMIKMVGYDDSSYPTLFMPKQY
jgi:hypothetical protein